MNGVYHFLGPDGLGTYDVRWEGQLRLDRVNRSADHLLVPGFVDLHFHGAYGIDFMSATTTDLEFLAGKLASEGYEAFLPTTVTADVEDVKRAVAQLPDHPMIPGFHLEGPFISPKFPGAQPIDHIVEPPAAASEWDAVLDDTRLRVITLAAEHPLALSLISKLMSRGVIVSQGHTNATFFEAKGGFEAGAWHATHLFNAMRPFHHREPGIAGYALTTPGMSVEVIYDRHHVSRDAMKLVVQCKHADEIIAVSDASAATRLPNGSAVQMWGHHAVVEAGTVRLADGTLAGSTITLLDAFRNLSQDFGEELAIRACCLNPRRALKLGPPRVYVEFDQSLNLVAVHQLS